jgi:uncharacterized membrane protein
MSTGFIIQMLKALGLAAVVFFIIIGLNLAIFGDQTGEDTHKPLLVVVPVLVTAFYFLIKATKKNEK